uniref:Uncharacterized protein n=1 Tax=Myoviridae sp. ctxlX31 TaxID=2827293 RepID=A0A8S5R4X0_9CAUD|nr:MAG TPA: hypothetical protein [Myoviridae sp. ctxlX31]
MLLLTFLPPIPQVLSFLYSISHLCYNSFTIKLLEVYLWITTTLLLLSKKLRRLKEKLKKERTADMIGLLPPMELLAVLLLAELSVL